MKVCFAVPVRDKCKHLRRTVDSVLKQSYSPMEILFSDQGSVDGSYEELVRLTSTYDGPNTVRILRCPVLEPRGMAGLNEHLNWIHNQTDAEIFVNSAADDMSLPERTAKVIRAFEEFDPAMVLNGMFFANPDGKYDGETGYPTEDGWVRADEVYTRYIGGSTPQSWTRAFYEKVEGLQGIGSPDMVLPFLACLDKGAYYLNERLHIYIKHTDSGNTGLEGVYRAAKTDDERLQLEELMHFQVSVGMFTAANKAKAAGLMTVEGTNAIVTGIIDRAASWQNCRHKMTLLKVPPISFKT